MDNRVFIIHGSEIIQQGLNKLIQEQFDIEPILLGSVKEIKSYSSISNSKIIFLIDSLLDKSPLSHALDSFKSHNSVKILLIRDRADKTVCKDDCDCCFSIMDAKTRIYELISSYLKIKSETGRTNSPWLTEREIDVVKQVAFGKTNKEIADQLCISIHTVISHRKNITEKLGIKSISGLTVYAILNHIVDTSSIDLE